MMYTLDELLKKMGAPEAKERGQIRWHYFDQHNDEIGGFAEVRLLDGGATLVAEVRRLRDGMQDELLGVAEDGLYNETLYLHARRSGSRYDVTKIAFDGEEYSRPQKSVIELGLSLFHARALDISILMVEQAFNKQDIMQPSAAAEHANFRGVPSRVKEGRLKDEFSKEKSSWGVVIPFRARGVANCNLPRL